MEKNFNKPISGGVRTQLLPSCCDKSGTSCYHDLVSRLMSVIDLVQVVPRRLIQTVRNKLLLASCQQVNNFLRGHTIRLVGMTCCESGDLINLVTS